jgi:hypothetical protein
VKRAYRTIIDLPEDGHLTDEQVEALRALLGREAIERFQRAIALLAADALKAVPDVASVASRVAVSPSADELCVEREERLSMGKADVHHGERLP